MDRRLIILLLSLIGIMNMNAQEFVTPANDALYPDSLLLRPTDSTTLQDSVRSEKRSPIEAPVSYQAKDSIVMTGGNWAYLYGEGVVKYQQIELQSEVIEISMDSTLVYATYGLDSLDMEFGYPVFKNGAEQYESKGMRYNFNSGKGYITDVITQQGEGYVTAGQTKKMDDDVLNMVGGRYTTCDDHDHPHFYIQMTKAKVRPGKDIVTGPVYLVIEDVPLPLALPFAFFPFSSSYSSGILMPTFGDESVRGFYLRDGGYYFAINDYMDLALTGEIYSKGSWGLAASSSYRKRYKFSGNFNASYLATKYGDKIPDLRPGQQDDYQVSKDFKLSWTHSQDPKANPYRTFSASVNFATSSYDRNNINSYYDGNATQNTKSSSVSLTQRFPNSPFTLSASMNVSQRTSDSTVSLTLPNLSITMSRIYPFKRKNAVGDERWYEKISMSYTGNLTNNIQTKEDLLFKSNLIKDWKNSMTHTIPISATFTFFNYLNISPTVNYRERWYTSKIEQAYDEQLQRMAPRDTSYGFYRVYDFDASIAASTTLYGMFQPLPFLGNKVQMIRHRFEPSVSFSATPDFGDPFFGYWQTYQYMDANGEIVDTRYSPYSHNGAVPTEGRRGSINFSVNNNLEMKVRSSQDSTGTKKISLIDNLSIGTSYNLAVDSFKWSNIQVGLRLKLSKSYTLNLNMTFDPYTYEAKRNANGEVTGRRVDVLRWNKPGKGIGRLMNTGTNFSYTFNNQTFKNLFGRKGDSNTASATPAPVDGATNNDAAEIANAGAASSDAGEFNRLRGQTQTVGEYDNDGYLVTEIPWSLSFSYGLTMGYDTQKFDEEKLEYKYAFRHTLSFNGSIQPTKNWRMNFNASYDFDHKKITGMVVNISRDLHCFQMTASLVPVGYRKSYTFSIAVNSSLLKDLKYDKRSNFREGQNWY